MAEQRSTARLGRILVIVGTVWVALAFAAGALRAGGTPLGNIVQFFQGTFILGLALIFFGRALSRQARRASAEEAMEGQRAERPAARRSTSRPTPRTAPSTPRTPEPRRETQPETKPVDVDELAAALGLDPDEGTPTEVGETPEATEAKPGSKSSADMIAEARRRWDKKS